MRDNSEWPSLIWGERRGGGDLFETVSPLDASVVATGELLDRFEDLEKTDLPQFSVFDALCARLANRLESMRTELVAAVRMETGFIPRDCEELIDGAIGFARNYASHPSTQLVPSSERFVGGDRQLALSEVPIGTLAVILPHNAFIPLAITCLLNGLRAGNRVILRSPLHSARSASLLSELLEGLPEIVPWVSVVVCAAPSFVDWFLNAPFPGLLQFFGSSRRASELISRGFNAGKSTLIDGEGNAWAYVDRTFPPARAAELLLKGAFRYNGQTCTSINGAIVHPDCFEEVTAAVAAQARRFTVGQGNDAEIGPVFNERQAEWCLDRISDSGGQVTAGGLRQGTFLDPTVVLRPDPLSDLVREGIFGPALWIAPGNAAHFASLWPSNRYPLCAAVLQEPGDPSFWTSQLPDLARLVVNGDPSIEDPFEYWGGYAPAGQNPVSAWPRKYRRTVQIDTPLVAS